jgi:hypothetical protein
MGFCIRRTLNRSHQSSAVRDRWVIGELLWHWHDMRCIEGLLGIRTLPQRGLMPSRGPTAELLRWVEELALADGNASMACNLGSLSSGLHMDDCSVKNAMLVGWQCNAARRWLLFLSLHMSSIFDQPYSDRLAISLVISCLHDTSLSFCSPHPLLWFHLCSLMILPVSSPSLTLSSLSLTRCNGLR